MSTTAVVREKGQVTLPKAVRERLGIEPGSRLSFSTLPDGTLVAHVLAKGADPLFGLLAKVGERATSLDDMDEAVTHAVRSRARRGR
jgi:AbrB family looped-hinge helix DNA binding protein